MFFGRINKVFRSFAFYLCLGYLVVYALCTVSIYVLASQVITKSARGYDRQDVTAESEELVELIQQSAGSNLLFAWLAGHGHDVTALIAVVSADNLASGIASAAFIAYLSSLTNVSYSATQYALFSSMMLLLPKFVAGFSGDFVDSFGYAHFFTTTSLLGLPVLGLVWLASRVKKPSSPLP